MKANETPMVDEGFLFDIQLFLGYLVDSAFEAKLHQLDPQLKSLFINPAGDYLQEVVIAQSRYLGKLIGKTSSPAQLELAEANIYSILQKIDPTHPFHQTPLVLLPVDDKIKTE